MNLLPTTNTTPMPTPTLPTDTTIQRKTQLYRFLIPGSPPSTPHNLPAIVAHLSGAGVWCEVTPLPDGETEILLKAKDPSMTLMPIGTFVEQVERGFSPIYKCRLPNGKI